MSQETPRYDLSACLLARCCKGKPGKHTKKGERLQTKTGESAEDKGDWWTSVRRFWGKDGGGVGHILNKSSDGQTYQVLASRASDVEFSGREVLVTVPIK